MSWIKSCSALVIVSSVLAISLVSHAPALVRSSNNLVTQWTERFAIVINDDSMFTAENGVVSGSGTKADPYIIEGWKIGGLSTGTAIDIRNTDVHFRIRDIYAYSCSIGVSMNSVDNGWVEDSRFINNTVGVSFFECHNCKVVNSTFEGSEVAIMISFSDVSQSANTFISNDIDVQRNKNEMPWELTWVGAVVCAAILVPLAVIITIVLYFRVRRFPPPAR